MNYQSSPEDRMKKQQKARLHRILNSALVILVTGQIGVIYYVTSDKKIEQLNSLPATEVTVQETAPEFETGDEAKAASTESVEPNLADSAVKSDSNAALQNAQSEVQKKSVKPAKSAKLKNKKASESELAAMDAGPVEDPWATADLSEKIEVPEKSAQEMRAASKEEKLLVQSIGIDEERVNLSTDAPSLIQELQLSEKQASVLAIKHQKLMGALRNADEEGASGLRRILINDHMAWAKEFLGREKFERYKRASSNLLASVR